MRHNFLYGESCVVGRRLARAPPLITHRHSSPPLLRDALLTTKLIDHSVPLIRAIVIHPDGRSESSRLAEERLEEAVGLARALDLDVRAEEIVRLRKTTPATLFGSGKVEELAALVRAAEA